MDLVRRDRTPLWLVLVAAFGLSGCGSSAPPPPRSRQPRYVPPAETAPHARVRISSYLHGLRHGEGVAETLTLDGLPHPLPDNWGQVMEWIRVPPTTMRLAYTTLMTNGTATAQQVVLPQQNCQGSFGGNTRCLGVVLGERHELTGACQIRASIRFEEGQEYWLRHDFFANGSCVLQCRRVVEVDAESQLAPCDVLEHAPARPPSTNPYAR